MRLIPLAAEVAGCLAVGALAVDEQVERLVEGPLDVAERPPGCLEAPLDLGGLGREPVLLLLVRPVLRRMRSLRDLRWSKMPRPRTVRDPRGREVLLTAERRGAHR